MSFKPYCGSEKIPKGHREGTIPECVEKKQVRLYGLRKVDKKSLAITKSKSKLPITREKLILMLVSLRGTIRRSKGRAEKSKNPEIAESNAIIWKNAEAQLKKVQAKLQLLENAKSKSKSKSKKSDILKHPSFYKKALKDLESSAKKLAKDRDLFEKSYQKLIKLSKKNELSFLNKFKNQDRHLFRNYLDKKKTKSKSSRKKKSKSKKSKTK